MKTLTYSNKNGVNYYFLEEIDRSLYSIKFTFIKLIRHPY